MLLAPWLAAAVAAAVVVEGLTACPPPAAVEERLHALLAHESGKGRPDRAQLESDGDFLRVSLVASDGSVIGERSLERQHRCEALADAAAVMIAAWEQETARPALAVVAARPAPARPWELGASAGAVLGGGTAAAVSVMAAGAVKGPVGGRAAMMVTTARTAALPGGDVRWRRSLLLAGPELRWSRSALAVALHAGAAAAWLTVDGRGLPGGQRHDDLAVGADAGLRLAWRRRGPRPFVEAGASFWPARAIVYEQPDGAQRALPRLEIMLAAGMAVGAP